MPCAITLGLVQMRCADADAQVNVARALQGIRGAAARGADVIALPELFSSPYFCRRTHDPSAHQYAESIPGPTTERLAAIAADLRVVLIGGSLYERAADGKHYNTCPVFESDGRLLGTYRKTHIPQDPGYFERDYFSAGQNPITVFTTSRGKIAPLICFDQWSPEAARIATLHGAELLVYPTAIGNVAGIAQWEGSWQEGWEIVQRGHSAANQVFVAAVNRVGTEGDTTFWGGSFVAGPLGQVRAHAGADEEILIIDCDLAITARAQDDWGILRHRRHDLYGPLVE